MENISKIFNINNDSFLLKGETKYSFILKHSGPNINDYSLISLRIALYQHSFNSISEIIINDNDHGNRKEKKNSRKENGKEKESKKRKCNEFIFEDFSQETKQSKNINEPIKTIITKLDIEETKGFICIGSKNLKFLAGPLWIRVEYMNNRILSNTTTIFPTPNCYAFFTRNQIKGYSTHFIHNLKELNCINKSRHLTTDSLIDSIFKISQLRFVYQILSCQELEQSKTFFQSKNSWNNLLKLIKLIKGKRINSDNINEEKSFKNKMTFNTLKWMLEQRIISLFLTYEESLTIKIPPNCAILRLCEDENGIAVKLFNDNTKYIIPYYMFDDNVINENLKRYSFNYLWAKGLIFSISAVLLMNPFSTHSSMIDNNSYKFLNFATVDIHNDETDYPKEFLPLEERKSIASYYQLVYYETNDSIGEIKSIFNNTICNYSHKLVDYELFLKNLSIDKAVSNNIFNVISLFAKFNIPIFVIFNHELNYIIYNGYNISLVSFVPCFIIFHKGENKYDYACQFVSSITKEQSVQSELDILKELIQ